LIVAERAFEVIISRRNARIAFQKGGIESGREHYRIMVAMHALFLVSCALESLLDLHDDWRTLSILALIATFVAEFIRYAAVITLGEHWNTRIIVRPDTAPVTRGIYRWMRHPNYVAVIIEIAALPLVRACWVTATVFSVANAWVLSKRIPAEEAALGEGYAAAFANVSRFLPLGGVAAVVPPSKPANRRHKKKRRGQNA
jgi:methyltransferase